MNSLSADNLATRQPDNLLNQSEAFVLNFIGALSAGGSERHRGNVENESEV